MTDRADLPARLRRPPKVINCECGDHAFAAITRGRVAIFDQDDAPLVREHSWYTRLGGYTAYAVSTANTMHRLFTGAPITDHVNGDGLDNRRRNLRPATVAQNAANRKHQRRAGTGYVGVYYDRTKNKFRFKATISIDGKNVHVGRFATAEEAARARDDAARKRWGEFAVLNFQPTETLTPESPQ